jgi:hypothetical protein
MYSLSWACARRSHKVRLRHVGITRRRTRDSAAPFKRCTTSRSVRGRSLSWQTSARCLVRRSPATSNVRSANAHAVPHRLAAHAGWRLPPGRRTHLGADRRSHRLQFTQRVRGDIPPTRWIGARPVAAAALVEAVNPSIESPPATSASADDPTCERFVAAAHRCDPARRAARVRPGSERGQVATAVRRRAVQAVRVSSSSG